MRFISVNHYICFTESVIAAFFNSNFWSTIFGGLFVSFIFYFLIESRVKNEIDKLSRKNKTKKFLVELSYNNDVANLLVKKSEHFLKSGTMQYIKYETKAFEDFLAEEMLNLSNSALFKFKTIISANLKQNNNLMDYFWLGPDVGKTAIRDKLSAKKEILGNAKKVILLIKGMKNHKEIRKTCRSLEIGDEEVDNIFTTN